MACGCEGVGALVCWRGLEPGGRAAERAESGIEADSLGQRALQYLPLAREDATRGGDLRAIQATDLAGPQCEGADCEPCGDAKVCCVVGRATFAVCQSQRGAEDSRCPWSPGDRPVRGERQPGRQRSRSERVRIGATPTGGGELAAERNPNLPHSREGSR